MGCSASFPSADEATLTKKTGIPFFLNASARAAVFFTTMSDAWGNGFPSYYAFLEIDDYQRRF
jgi:hypothetical protein